MKSMHAIVCTYDVQRDAERHFLPLRAMPRNEADSPATCGRYLLVQVRA